MAADEATLLVPAFLAVDTAAVTDTDSADMSRDQGERSRGWARQVEGTGTAEQVETARCGLRMFALAAAAAAASAVLPENRHNPCTVDADGCRCKPVRPAARCLDG